MLKQAYIFASGAFVATAAMFLMGANGSPSYEGAVVMASETGIFQERCREGYEVKSSFGYPYRGYIVMQKKVR